MTEDPKTEEFDANRFGKFRMPTDFFRWAISTPLPKAREEDLWHDTIPPGPIKVEGRSPEPLPQEPLVQLKSDDRKTVPKILHLSPEEAQALRHGSGKRAARNIAIIIALASILGGIVAFAATREDETPPGESPKDHQATTQLPQNNEAKISPPGITSDEPTSPNGQAAKSVAEAEAQATQPSASPSRSPTTKPLPPNGESQYNHRPTSQKRPPGTGPSPHPQVPEATPPVQDPHPAVSSTPKSPFQPK